MTEQEQMSICYKDIFGSLNGKKVIGDLDKQCRYNQNSFNPESARITDYNLGVLWVIQYIHKMIDKNLMDEQTNKVINEGTKL